MESFVPFPKIARWSRDVIVTEKIDGTNAQVVVSDDGTEIWAGSRTRPITPEADNFGFARWVADHREELLQLGPGRHFGEWWGAGIQRKYGLAEKRFSLFNVSRWSGDDRPGCCGFVPVLWRGPMDEAHGAIARVLESLRSDGSAAAPGFMKPEGVVIYHVASGQLFKKTLESDEKHKGEV
jgi:RNA ligase